MSEVKTGKRSEEKKVTKQDEKKSSGKEKNGKKEVKERPSLLVDLRPSLSITHDWFAKDEMISSMQKHARMNEFEQALFATFEVVRSGFAGHATKRAFVIAFEDVGYIHPGKVIDMIRVYREMEKDLDKVTNAWKKRNVVEGVGKLVAIICEGSKTRMANSISPGIFSKELCDKARETDFAKGECGGAKAQLPFELDEAKEVVADVTGFYFGLKAKNELVAAFHMNRLLTWKEQADEGNGEYDIKKYSWFKGIGLNPRRKANPLVFIWKVFFEVMGKDEFLEACFDIDYTLDLIGGGEARLIYFSVLLYWCRGVEVKEEKVPEVDLKQFPWVEEMFKEKSFKDGEHVLKVRSYFTVAPRSIDMHTESGRGVKATINSLNTVLSKFGISWMSEDEKKRSHRGKMPKENSEKTFFHEHGSKVAIEAEVDNPYAGVSRRLYDDYEKKFGSARARTRFIAEDYFRDEMGVDYGTRKKKESESGEEEKKKKSSSVPAGLEEPEEKEKNTQRGERSEWKRKIKIRDTEVVKLQIKDGVLVQDCDVYIGRRFTMGGHNRHASKWRNIFKVKECKSSEDCLAKYEAHVRAHVELIADLYELDLKLLGCWCAPEPCHGDVLKKLVRETRFGGRHFYMDYSLEDIKNAPTGQKRTGSAKKYVYLPKKDSHEVGTRGATQSKFRLVFKGEYKTSETAKVVRSIQRGLLIKMIGGKVLLPVLLKRADKEGEELFLNYCESLNKVTQDVVKFMQDGNVFVAYPNLGTESSEKWKTIPHTDFDGVDTEVIIQESLGLTTVAKIADSDNASEFFGDEFPEFFVTFLGAALLQVGDVGMYNTLVVDGDFEGVGNRGHDCDFSRWRMIDIDENTTKGIEDVEKLEDVEILFRSRPNKKVVAVLKKCFTTFGARIKEILRGIPEKFFRLAEQLELSADVRKRYEVVMKKFE